MTKKYRHIVFWDSENIPELQVNDVIKNLSPDKLFIVSTKREYHSSDIVEVVYVNELVHDAANFMIMALLGQYLSSAGNVTLLSEDIPLRAIFREYVARFDREAATLAKIDLIAQGFFLSVRKRDCAYFGRSPITRLQWRYQAKSCSEFSKKVLSLFFLEQDLALNKNQLKKLTYKFYNRLHVGEIVKEEHINQTLDKTNLFKIHQALCQIYQYRFGELDTWKEPALLPAVELHNNFI